MSDTPAKPITGAKVFAFFAIAFAVIIGVNLTLAFKAVATFPGLEVRNSYVASQNFDESRAAQEALNWEVSARVEAGQLRLSIQQDGVAVAPKIISAVLGRATNVAEDQTPELTFDGRAFVAPVTLARGNWNLRLVAMADDGTIFKQRVIVESVK